MRLGIAVLRAALVLTLGLCLWTAAQAKAERVEYLMVPSAAMGRDIPPHLEGGVGQGIAEDWACEVSDHRELFRLLDLDVRILA
jgi:hypothetical protein